MQQIWKLIRRAFPEFEEGRFFSKKPDPSGRFSLEIHDGRVRIWDSKNGGIIVLKPCANSEDAIRAALVVLTPFDVLLRDSSLGDSTQEADMEPVAEEVPFDVAHEAIRLNFLGQQVAQLTDPRYVAGHKAGCQKTEQDMASFLNKLMDSYDPEVPAEQEIIDTLADILKRVENAEHRGASND